MSGDNDGEYTFKWFEGPETPETVKEIIMLSENPQVESTKNSIEEFVCEIYATTKNKLRNVKKVNEARSCIFGQSYGMIDDMEAFKKKVVSFDASNLPPCLRELEQQILRTAYWFEGPETPETVKEIIMPSENSQESIEDNENLHRVDDDFDDDDDDDDNDDGQSDVGIDININTEYEEIVSEEIKVMLAFTLILNMKK
ncbi:hypothetical protein TSAR_012114 [Trichomalopsis sarcophagae]|uniref:Uncharacterized protein n=1 Tax=Trichomalopsis sarcophagae TaxID=543379 RepID=A0A232F7P8_9HYME|nr:hypothetical protein TSAR_012114 [Trichomalopsis sarcophagae]